LCAQPDDGRAKLWIDRGARCAFAARTGRAVQARGDYLPVAVSGARARQRGRVRPAVRRRDAIVVVAGRLFASLGLEPGLLPVGEAAWAETAADLSFLGPEVPFVNVLTGETLAAREGRLPLAQALAGFPGALLVRAAGPA
jgi:maltooligosyltrehalose synthase